MRNRILLGAGPVLGLLVFDLWFRRQFIKNFLAIEWLTYFSSAVYLLLFGFVFWNLVRPALTTRLRLWSLAIVMGGISALIYIGQYLYFTYFGVLPNVATYQYMFDNTAVSFANAGDAVSPMALLALVLSALLFSPLWLAGYRAWIKETPQSGKRPWKSALAIVLMTPVLFHNVSLEQGMVMPSVHAVFSLVKAGEHLLVTDDEYRKYLQVGNRTKLPVQSGTLPYNVLYIVNESVRAGHLSEYGYERNTTPRMKAFLERHKERAFVFERFYTNSTTSRESYPSMLTGVHPYENFTKLHTQPLVYEYANVFPDTYVFLLSSHRYNNNNFRLFIKSDALDKEFYRENSGLPVLNNQGIDDKDTIAAFERFMDEAPLGQRFMGVLHLNTTHFPYNVVKEYTRFNGTELVDRYDNALYYLDLIHEHALQVLEKQGHLDDTIVVFSSDHGEAFGEHGMFGHQRLFYEEGTRVPFWILLPAALADKYREVLNANRTKVHSGLDIVPTIVDLIGVASDPVIAESKAQLFGQSLIQPDGPETQPVVVYNGYTAVSLKRGFALADNQWRMLLHSDRETDDHYRFEAYDVSVDPEERNNIWGSVTPELRERWLAALERYPKLHEDLLTVLKDEGFAVTHAPVAAAR